MLFIISIFCGIIGMWYWRKHNKSLKPWGDIYGIVALLFSLFALILIFLLGLSVTIGY